MCVRAFTNIRPDARIWPSNFLLFVGIERRRGPAIFHSSCSKFAVIRGSCPCVCACECGTGTDHSRPRIFFHSFEPDLCERRRRGSGRHGNSRQEEGPGESHPRGFRRHRRRCRSKAQGSSLGDPAVGRQSSGHAAVRCAGSVGGDQCARSRPQDLESDADAGVFVRRIQCGSTAADSSGIHDEPRANSKSDQRRHQRGRRHEQR